MTAEAWRCPTVIPVSETWPEQIRIVQSTDPARSDLEAQGWRLVAESWGARLHAAEEDLPRLRHLVGRARAHGYDVVELGAGEAAEIAALDAVTSPDFPAAGPATEHEPVGEDGAAQLLDRGRIFGVRDGGGRLVALTTTSRREDRVETGFTSVHQDHRRQGLGTAIKAASVLAWWEDGARVFGAGGAQTNAASLAMNWAVGYTVTERWLTYAPPA